MASGPVAGGVLRRSESKVYTRKSHGKNPNKLSGANPPPSSNQTLATTTTATADDLHSSLQQPPAVTTAPPQSRHYLQFTSDEEASSLNRLPPDHPPDHHSGHRLGNRSMVTLSLARRPPHEVREIRRKLVAELERVRDAIKRIEAKELQLAYGGGGPPSQLSVNDVRTAVGGKRAPVMSEAASTTPAPLSRQLSVSVPPSIGAENSISESMEKEKRTPKANQFYRNSDFLLGKEKFPPPESGGHKKSKSGGSKKPSAGKLDHSVPETVETKAYSNAFTSCRPLLLMLMHHEFGWVFNKPVDFKALGLYDYLTIIKHPMDLGTVKTRLSKNWYSTPVEFAEDVRLTFRNAMTYNPKGQDVYKMAQQLSKIFEERWTTIEADCAYVSRPPLVSGKVAPAFDKRQTLERSDSTVQPMMVNSKPKQVNHAHHIGRNPALKKPKAKELNKRDMTFDEKQKLSRQLQSLPQEKLDNVVQIIKKRSSSVNQDDEEIEVDIDSMDPETLWELDRFVTNYKKSLSKYKRKAELAMQARAAAEHHKEEGLRDRNADHDVTQVATESKIAEVNQKSIAAASPVVREKYGDNSSGSSGSSSSGSDSDSSDSGSESDSDSE